MPTTPNLGMQRPLNGTFVGVWDGPVNGNWDILDNLAGGVATIPLTNVPVVLSAAQYACNFIVFTGALTGNVVITFPTVGRFWMVQNNCTNITTFSVTCKANPASNYIALPPNEAVVVMSDGSNMSFVGLGRVGTYWDFAGSTVPLWVTASSPAPYLNCDGSAFNPITYPALNAYLGGAAVPDLRGRFRATLNQGSGRLTAIDGNTFLANGGSNAIAIANLPPDPGHLHSINNHAAVFVPAGSGGAGNYTVWSTAVGSMNTNNATTGMGGTSTPYISPSIVGGLTLIRAG